jgi:hypothetical protein
LTCLCGIGSESLFIASRIQTTMAKMGMMPRIFDKIDDQGQLVLLYLSNDDFLCMDGKTQIQRPSPPPSPRTQS